MQTLTTTDFDSLPEYSKGFANTWYPDEEYMLVTIEGQTFLYMPTEFRMNPEDGDWLISSNHAPFLLNTNVESGISEDFGTVWNIVTAEGKETRAYLIKGKKPFDFVFNVWNKDRQENMKVGTGKVVEEEEVGSESGFYIWHDMEGVYIKIDIDSVYGTGKEAFYFWSNGGYKVLSN